MEDSYTNKTEFRNGSYGRVLEFSLNIIPEMVMFVPEGRNEITTEGGLNVIRHEKHLKK